jgi:hypothetical protein
VVDLDLREKRAFLWSTCVALDGHGRPRIIALARQSVELNCNSNRLYALMISVEPFSESVTVTTTTGKAFFIAAPAVAAGSLVSNDVLICPSTFKRNRLSMGRA